MSTEYMEMFFNKFGEDLDMVRSGKMTMEILAQRATACYEMLSPPHKPVQEDSSSLVMETSSSIISLSDSCDNDTDQQSEESVAVNHEKKHNSSKKKIPKTLIFENQIKSKGFRVGVCCAVDWGKQRPDGMWNRIARQCREDSVSDEGFCIEHHKEWTEKKGIRGGFVKPDNLEIGVDFLDDEYNLSGVTKGHSNWIKIWKNAWVQGRVVCQKCE